MKKAAVLKCPLENSEIAELSWRYYEDDKAAVILAPADGEDPDDEEYMHLKRFLLSKTSVKKNVATRAKFIEHLQNTGGRLTQ